MTTTLEANAVKERPILFSGAMTKAILEGRKTQTRRVLKLPSWSTQDWNDFELDIDEDASPIAIAANTGCFSTILCPYGKPGDRLWVRETWRPRSWGSDFDWMMVEFAASAGETGTTKCINPYEVWDTDLRAESLWEQLSGECQKAECPQSGSGDFTLERKDGKFPIKWRPSIHMPRAASRLTLEVTEVHVERLQGISEEDAIAEGVERDGDGWKCYGNCSSHKTGHNKRTSATASFMSLWDSINADKYPWDSNPWVWAVSFKSLPVKEATSAAT